jgi:Zn-dependent protease
MRRITEANNLGNYDTSWFNDLITPLAGAIAIIQLFHECGHSFFAWKDNFKMSSPTILPLITLPYLSFQRRLKTSPPDLMSLFNFAYAGPALGMLISSILLWVGLTLSVNMDSTALEYAPSLPVGLLRLSTLGKSMALRPFILAIVSSNS